MIASRPTLTASAFLSMFFLGIGTGIIGAASRNIGLSPYQIGLLIAVQNVGFLLSVLTAGMLADSLSKTRLLLVGSLILAAAFFLFYLWRPFGLNLAVMFFVGVGIGSYEGVSDTLLLDLQPRRGSLFININHLFATLGALSIAAYLLFLQMSWRRSLTQSAAAVALLALAFGLLRPPPRAAGAVQCLGERFAILKSHRVTGILFVTALFAIGLEYGIEGILTTFLMELRGFDQVTSKIGLIVLIAGIAAGRLVLGVLARRERLLSILVVLFTAAAALTGLLFSLRLPQAAVYGLLALCGLTISSLLPFTITLAGLLHREIAGTAMGVIKLAIPVGGILVPFLMSLASRYLSFQVALLLFPAVAAASALTLLLAGHAVRSRLYATPSN